MVKSNQLYKYLFLIIFGVLFLTSCDYFFSKKVTKYDSTIDTLIDFNTVDAYPLFPECKDIPSREKQKICFQIKMSEHIQMLLKNNILSTATPNNDTLMVLLKVLQTGRIEIISVKSLSKNIVYEHFIDSILQQNANQIPALQPAIKRGMTVATQFELPIIIQNTTF